MEALIVIITSIMTASITAYVVTLALAGRLMKELDDIEKEYRKKLLETGVEAIHEVRITANREFLEIIRKITSHLDTP